MAYTITMHEFKTSIDSAYKDTDCNIIIKRIGFNPIECIGVDIHYEDCKSIHFFKFLNKYDIERMWVLGKGDGVLINDDGEVKFYIPNKIFSSVDAFNTDYDVYRYGVDVDAENFDNFYNKEYGSN